MTRLAPDLDLCQTTDMQPDVELGRRMGYELKRAQAALRAAMDEALRRHGLTVP